MAIAFLKSWLDELGIDSKTNDEISKTDSAIEPNADFASSDQHIGLTKRSGNHLLRTFHSSIQCKEIRSFLVKSSSSFFVWSLLGEIAKPDSRNKLQFEKKHQFTNFGSL